MSARILFHAERVNCHSKVCVCVCVHACVRAWAVCVCWSVSVHIYTTSWAQKVKTCLAKGCCAAGLGLYIRFHMPCKFKSMTFPFSQKIPALLVPSTRRLTQCWQKEGMVQGTFATTAVLRFLPFGALWRLSLDWSQVLARSNAT